MAHSREVANKLGEAFVLVEAALGLSLLAYYECAGVINNPQDLATATEAPAIALVPLLRRARELLNEVT